MDTGYHDADPVTVTTNITYLDGQEVIWHRDKIEHSGTGIDPASGNNTGRRGTILLSHHPLFSFSGVGSVGDDGSAHPAVNPHLSSAFAGLLDQVACWLWGHEHNLLIFNAYAGLKRGRCIGAGAIPALVGGGEYTPADGLVIPDGETGPPSIVPGSQLKNNGVSYYHAYAILKLDGPAATLSYYQVDSADLVPGQVPPASEPVVPPERF